MNHIIVDSEGCKGCRLCVEFCPKKCIVIGSHINIIGYQYAEFTSGKCCTACGICYYVCPEPGAITVFTDEETVK